jgi:L-fucose/D-arabinose isomerase
MPHEKMKPCNQLAGRMPKIGIRPCIDGRANGVRESLEAQTMNMARSAAELITANLRHANGLPVECVIAPTTIGGVTEAALCADVFASENVTATLTVTPCWCYGTETMDTDPLTIKAVWGFNGTERPGAVYLAAVMAAHNQYGLPAFSIYGRDIQDAGELTIPKDVSEKILRFAKCAMVAGYIKGKSYASIGGTCMGIAGSITDPLFYLKYFGIRVEWLDQTEIVRRIERGIYDPKEYKRAKEWVAHYCREGPDYFADSGDSYSRGEKDTQWEWVIKATMIIRDIMIGNPALKELGYPEEALGRNAIFGGVQGQRQWTDHYPNHDFSESILSTSFDWNGIREPMILATENDHLNGISMLIGHLISDSASVFADVRTYWSPDSIQRVTGWRPDKAASNGIIHLINSGAAALDGCGQQRDQAGTPVMKPFWDITSEDADACLKATLWDPANIGYFRGGGFSSQFVTRAQMPVTMIRVNITDGQGPTVQIAEGYTVDLPEAVSKVLYERTDKTWPCTWFAPRLNGVGPFKDVYSVMSYWGANHGSFNFGHIGDQVITLCSMLRIPVVMHNVDEQRIFRPHAWGAFGTKDPENADLQACRNFGPLYGLRRLS